ncbi:SGNH/GDSL hydrolase family protein [Anabaena sp. UHCC 0204]|uniref:SGNH/GDSL hydrolase family protein n=1 Tax=Anabaena sp. UHCC 0204 TaxID=2590009 RepID=UPI0014451DB2|nr:SGNH/GDSL hydrolase family protein [Anabaena sp. UHCC 0204]MTJ06286.1 G-D-S-L family lipolytic protein [Anabaena sp. UHCC 0204]
MSEPYLLAASLLTGLTIPASALPQIPRLPEGSLSLLDLVQGFQFHDIEKPSHQEIALPEFSDRTLLDLAQGFQSYETEKMASKEIALPEFSDRTLAKSGKSSISRKITSKNSSSTPIKSSFNFQPAKARSVPASGSELYQHRIASLRSGQIYTRTNDYENLASARNLHKTSKLTYQDWKSLLAMEANAVTKGQGANRLSVLVGDSLSLWFPKEKLPTGKLWLNQGISGDTSQGVLKRLSAFSSTKPDAIYVMIGINDLRKGATDKSILLNLHRIIHNLRQSHPSSQIIVQSILPVRSQRIANSRIRHINTQIALIARKQGANYLNIHNWFTDLDGNMRSELTTDGLHLSRAGYEVWQSALEQIETRVAQRQLIIDN